MIFRGTQVDNNTILPYIRHVAANIELKNIYFGYAEPLPEYGVPLDFYSRITIPITGKIVVDAAFDGEISEKEMRPGDFLFTGNKGWARGRDRDPCSAGLGIVFMESYIRVVYSETDKNGEIAYNPWYHTSSGPKEITLFILQALNKLMFMINADRSERASHLLKALILEVIEELENDTRSDKGKSERTFQLVKEYIHQNYYTPINRKTLCQELNLNPSYVSTLFQKQANESLNTYLNRIRMERAIFLLKNYNTISIHQTACQCGFTSEGYFIKAFKKYYGTTPGAFRVRELIN